MQLADAQLHVTAPVIASQAKQSMPLHVALWIASRSLSSGGATAPTRWLAMTMWMLLVRQINPTGKSAKSLSIPLAKNIPLSPSGKSVI
ncbi:hypothetical protein OZ411_11785 [Bradyrhizobium sp. Arg237L]|uniref:hypothetical protein n=1 Tax=Bradyrhizobium sp. Arg237L TaxID=3003352 RepID=UPI00249DB759|nr:hypothetical protein [Bradyrhizobium sp. Arg237L]MDI4233495.1 hypothetical protein [Bradyrhizobium sp. Arg237L]